MRYLSPAIAALTALISGACATQEGKANLEEELLAIRIAACLKSSTDKAARSAVAESKQLLTHCVDRAHGD